MLGFTIDSIKLFISHTDFGVSELECLDKRLKDLKTIKGGKDKGSPISTTLVYTKAGAVEYKDNIPNIKDLIDYKEIEAEKVRFAQRQKEEEERRAREEEARKIVEAQKERMEKFRKNCLKTYDNSHPELVQLVKSKMQVPKSFEIVGEGKFGVTDDGKAFVNMTYEAQNAYGVILERYVRAEVNPEDCSIVRILEER